MIRALGRRFEAFFAKVTPDPFVLAVLLTFVVFGLAFAIEGTSPLEIVRAWQSDAGFFGLLAFTMQMVLILVTGHAVASAPTVRRGVRWLASMPKSGASGAALVAAVAMIAALLNWGLGLIVGALLAREVGKALEARAIPAHYPLIVAAGYAGLMCWHGGLSGTAPLMVTNEADLVRFLGPELAEGMAPLPFDHTVLTLGNAVVTGGLVVLVPLACWLLSPAPDECASRSATIGAVDEADEPPPPAKASVPGWLGPALWGIAALLTIFRERAFGDAIGWFVLAAAALVAVGGFAIAEVRVERGLTIPERLERSGVVGALLVFALAAACARWLLDNELAKLDPNAVSLAFLTLGLALHGNLRSYARAVDEAVRGAAGIVLQFPFYAGIMGVMRTTGLAASFATSLASIAPASLYTAMTFLSAGVVNLFVPSGGGQWAVQGPIAVRAAEALHVPLEQVVMAVAYGDQWTNMLQPFWALPLLAITGIKARDILGYTTLFLLIGGVWIAACLIVWARLG
ncbi:MAG: short-chain fatty acid transporter [Sandaracinaceae bacterium]